MQTTAPIEHRRFSSAEYFKMGELGILPESGVELWDGEVILKNGRGTPYRWTYDQYVEMARGGILREDERTELIDGEIVRMTPVGHRHVFVVDNLTAFIGAWAQGRAILRVQSPVRFNTVEAPQPDITVLRMHPDRYKSREAGPWDALLMIEVADTSVIRDRDLKAPMYARAAVPEFWLVNVTRESVSVHLQPLGGEYTDVHEYRRGESWQSPALDDRTVEVEEVFGPA